MIEVRVCSVGGSLDTDAVKDVRGRIVSTFRTTLHDLTELGAEVVKLVEILFLHSPGDS